MITDFTKRTLTWQIVNDDVMGGVSTSRFVVGTNGVARFSGTLSLENNGGFASVRSEGKLPDLTGHEVLVVRVKGDGRTYQMRVRSEVDGGATDYRAEFPTRQGVWTEHRLPLADFVATWRAQTLPDAPPINPARVMSLGFLMADKKAGPFALEIDWVLADGHHGGQS